MIYGVGIDLVEVSRIERLMAQYGTKFSERVLARAEYDGFTATSRPVWYLANRFAAKEALSKALGTGLRDPVTLHSISMHSDESGRPYLRFHGRLPTYLSDCGVTRTHLSISHEKGLACALVMLETDT